MNWWRKLTGRGNAEESDTLADINGAAMAIVESGNVYSDEAYSKLTISSSDKNETQIEVKSKPWIVTRVSETEPVPLIVPDPLIDREFKENPGSTREINDVEVEFNHPLIQEEDDELVVDAEQEKVIQEKQQDDLQDALQKGLAIKLRDLESNTNGWAYRDIPVMVYGVDVKTCADPTARQEFYHRVHLIDCCTELQNPEQHAMIGVDYESLQGNSEDIEFELCHDCLCHVNYLDYRHRARTDREEFLQYFNFAHYVMMQGSEFFKDRKFRIWPEKSHLKAIKTVDLQETNTCECCGWEMGNESYLLSEEQCNELGIAPNSCILCAQEHSGTSVMIPGALSETLYQERFRQLNPDVRDWQTLRLHLDKSWHSLTYCLQREKAPLPELYFVISEVGVVAPMAWPQLSRAIVVEANEEMNQGGWDIWSRKDVLASF